MSEWKGWTLTVSELNSYVDRSLRSDPILRSIRLSGEISGFKTNASGHWYFTLKDEGSRIDCAMFRSDAQRMSFRPADGDQVLVHGYVTVYAAGGRYQFVADAMRPEGVGSLYQRFERLKKKLEDEGLFDESRKQSLPIRPRKIAVVTSETGAVWHDICRVARRRDPGVPIVLVPASVQGATAAPEIVSAIRTAAALRQVDVIIVGRGGGSMEDLWCFNDEQVARAIAACPIPVISAVGHETDFTIADFVADVRASTPSNASEMAVPDRSETTRALRLMRRRFDACAMQQVNELQLQAAQLRRRLAQVQPDTQLQNMLKRLQLHRMTLDQLMDNRLAALPLQLERNALRLQHAVNRQVDQAEQKIVQQQARLHALSPLRVLERGYAWVSGPSGAVTSAQHAPDLMTLHFHDGTVKVRKDETTDGNKKENEL